MRQVRFDALPRCALSTALVCAASLLLVASPSPAQEGHGGEGEPKTSEGLQRAECVGWVGETYRLGSMAEDLDLDLSERIEEIRACMVHDTGLMAVPIPVPWCDNVFKIHCSGLDLLAEIGDALVERCATLLSDSLGVDIRRDKAWSPCAEQEVFDRYSMHGEASDEATCRRILFEECEAKIDDSDRADRGSGDS